MSIKFNISTRVSPATMDDWNALLLDRNTTTPTLLREIIHGVLGLAPPHSSINENFSDYHSAEPDNRAVEAAEMARRGFSVPYIAARLKIPYADVRKIMEGQRHAPRL
jgi:hypothetical protein